MSLVTLETPDGPLRADLDRPIDVSIPLRFDGPQPEFFGAPVATAYSIRNRGGALVVHRVTV